MTSIKPYTAGYREAVLALSMRAWEPVFPKMYDSEPRFVLDAFYPDGWRTRQLADLTAVLDDEPGNVDLAFIDGEELAGWVCTRLHPRDSMGEVYVLAVDPRHQRRGVATALVAHSCARARDAGMRMVMVETGGDPGHAPARAAYEHMDFARWPVGRYFRELR